LTALEERLRKEVQGDVAFDSVTRALYATDASIYQIEPRGVVVPKTVDDIAAVVGICRNAGVPVLPRGAGTSQCGQTVGDAIVVDTSKHLRAIEDLDTSSRPGSTRARSRSPERAAEARTAVLSDRSVDRKPRDARRHDRE
jgi:FAD/FMN-containing dehydrogenase